MIPPEEWRLVKEFLGTDAVGEGEVVRATDRGERRAG
jgi:hypothetical protein